MKNLVIVESPTKARTIGRFLGNNYEILASMGHIMDLPKSTLGVDIEHDFTPGYEMMPDKKKIIAELKAAGKKADNIILATDPDREGEAIAAHVKEILTDKKAKKFSRVVFHEITKEAIEEAFKTPREVDKNLVDAQIARRILDRLVGYNLSPILWRKVRRGLSAGRVQSVALRLIVEREREIEKFKKENYWTISVQLVNGSELMAHGEKETTMNNEQSAINPTMFELVEIKGEKIEVSQKINLYDGEYNFAKTIISNEDLAKKTVEDLKTKEFVVSDVTKKEMRRTPPPPYTTSTLQQDGARRMGLSGKRTMSLAQKLYEEGFITYHRTDSMAMSLSAINAFRSYAESQFGKNYVPQKPRLYKGTQKNAQEAHEAIRPTKVELQASEVSAQLGAQYGKLYDIIWRRAVATQMAEAVTESTVVMVSANPKSQIPNPNNESQYELKANGSVLVFEGFLKINPYALNDNKLPDFKANESLAYVNSASEAHETTPPPRYNDASIIKTLEEKGIGRPSTYAAIISTIEGRGYIERVESKFVPTSVGIAVNDFLVANFSTIDDIPFTATMEDELDQIASGEKQWVPVIKDFYTPFAKGLSEVKDAVRVKIAVEETTEQCPECGQGNLVIRTGRFGKFLACSRFPECKFTKQFVQETNLLCPKDGAKIVLKKTKKGRRFYGCSNYPKCDFAAWKMQDIKKEQSPKSE